MAFLSLEEQGRLTPSCYSEITYDPYRFAGPAAAPVLITGDRAIPPRAGPASDKLSRA